MRISEKQETTLIRRRSSDIDLGFWPQLFNQNYRVCDKLKEANIPYVIRDEDYIMMDTPVARRVAREVENDCGVSYLPYIMEKSQERVIGICGGVIFDTN